MNIDLGLLSNWSKANKLSLNTKKIWGVGAEAEEGPKQDGLME